MRKFADIYLATEPWSIVEKGFHSDRGRVSESLFAQANEHMGVRASFEEGYSGDSLVGSYVNGVYEEHIEPKGGYKGISNRLCFAVNTVDWSHLRLTLDGETLDLAISKFKDFIRRLDFRTGLLSRNLVWTTKSGKETELKFERFLSMDNLELGFQRLSLKALNHDTTVNVIAGTDFSILHEMQKTNYWNQISTAKDGDGVGILAQTSGLKQRMYAGFRLSFAVSADAGGGSGGSKDGGSPGAHGIKVSTNLIERDLFAGREFEIKLSKSKEISFEKVSVVAAARRQKLSDKAFADAARDTLKKAPNFETALAANRTYWDAVWEVADIEIEGDPVNQQGIRFSIFQLEQTFRGKTEGANIGAKGLTGEAYNGNAFWDTEVYCLPYYLFKHPETAKALIDYRYKTLPEAIARAKDLDCEGACYPVATIDGTESCTLWQHASLQFQPTTAVAYAIWHYAKVTGDKAWLANEGLEMLIQISRFLATRVQYSVRKGKWGYYCVMGPDEFQMMVHNNAYTNYMAKRSLEYTLEVLSDLGGKANETKKRLDLSKKETDHWKEIAENMFIPKEKGSKVFEQHEGYFDLPHVDIDSIPPEQFPLYHSWSYDRIYRNDMIKQPDVLMFMLLYNQSFSFAEKLANYDYYEPRTIHESSLSPSVHSILAAELGKDLEAYNFFGFATRIDLDNYNRNTREGLHLTSIAGAWMNIVYGFGGFRSDGPVPVFNPSIPAAWKSYSFRIRYAQSVVEVRAGRDKAALRLLEGKPLTAQVGGKEVRIEKDAIFVPLYAPKGAKVTVKPGNTANTAKSAKADGKKAAPKPAGKNLKSKAGV